MNTKYIFVTGGVTSSLGKGIIAASLAKLLQSRGLSVTIQKLDPYINIDPDTLNPYEHGECYFLRCMISMPLSSKRPIIEASSSVTFGVVIAINLIILASQ